MSFWGSVCGIVLTFLLTCLTLVPSALAAEPDLVATTTPAAAPAGSNALDANMVGMACPQSSDCTAVGSYTAADGSTESMLMNEVAGIWGPATEARLPANASPGAGISAAAPSSVVCPAAGDCTAIGTYYAPGSLEGYEVSEIGGTWAMATELSLPANAAADPTVEFSSLSCPSVGDCVGVGDYGSDQGGEGFFVSETDGVWGTATEVSLPDVGNGYLSSVSCSSVGNCAAVGAQGVVGMCISERGGVWSAPQSPNLPSDAVSSQYGGLDAVSCPADGDCSAVGDYEVAGGITSYALSETGGVWGDGVELDAPGATSSSSLKPLLTSIDCWAAGDCVAAGSYVPEGITSGGLWAAESGGTWGSEQAATLPADADTASNSQLQAISCDASGNCVATGFYTDADGLSRGVFLSGSQGMLDDPAAASAPSGAAEGQTASTTAVACAPLGGCSAAGRFVDVAGQTLPLAFAAGASTGAQLTLPSDAGQAAATSLHAVSCGARGDCAAVGAYVSDSEEPFVINRVDGIWQPSIEIAPPPVAGSLGVGGTLQLVSCPTADSCTAVGQSFDSHHHYEAFAVTESNGVWGPAAELPLPDGAPNSGPYVTLTSLSCPSLNQCVAVGSFGVGPGPNGGANDPLLLTEMNGNWTAQSPAAPSEADGSGGFNPGLELEAVSCSSSGECTAVGSGSDGKGNSYPASITETGGSWGSATNLPLPADAAQEPDGQLNAISCTAAGTCVAAGSYQSTGPTEPALLASESDGAWSTFASPVPAGIESAPPFAGGFESAGQIGSVSCVDADECVAVGYYYQANQGYYPLLLSGAGTHWVVASVPYVAIGLENPTTGSVSCPAAQLCVAAGVVPDEDYLLLDENGTWGTSIPVSSGLSDISCPSATDCAAVGGGAQVSPTVADLVTLDPPAETSSPTGSASPRPLSAPTVAGTLQAGDRVAARTGNWSGSGTLLYRYQWQRCQHICVDIAHATGSSYRLTTADVGAKLKVIVEAIDSVGLTASTSRTYGPVLPSAAELGAFASLLSASPTTKIPVLIAAHGYRLRFRPRADGRVTVTWYLGPRTAFATGTVSFSVGTTAVLQVRLTKAGFDGLARGQTRQLHVVERLQIEGLKKALHYRRTVTLRI